MKYYFRALFEKEIDGGYTVTFPDVEEAVTYGETLQEAVEMAKDCLGLCLETREDEGKDLPQMSNETIACPKNGFMMMIEFDTIEYDRKYNKRSVRKNVTIPAWLNNIAEEHNINFSNVLQNALRAQLNIK